MFDIYYLKKFFIYDPVTGSLMRTGEVTGKGHTFARVYREAGTVSKDTGVWTVAVDGYKLPKASVCFALYHGRWPDHLIDHIDGDPGNQAIDNLREATALQNSWNHRVRSDSKTQVKGVTLCKATGRWRADIRIMGKTKNLGRFNTIKEASDAYATAAKLHFGEFARVA